MMKTIPCLALLTMLASPAVTLADCKSDIEEVTRAASAKPGDKGDLERRQMSRLRDVATYLSRTGRESACQNLVATMRELVEQREDVAERSSEVARYAVAPSITEQGAPFQASELNGSVVRSPTGEEIGEIQDLVLDSNGRVLYLVLHEGGIIGIGGRRIAVEWPALRRTEDGESFVLRSSAEDLEQVGELPGDSYPQTPTDMFSEAGTPPAPAEAATR